jgi:transcription elongation factor GreA
MSEITYLTQEGYDKLKAELEELRTKGRSEISRQIGEAREKGDLSENAEYDAAKDAQGLLELRISKLETLVAKSRVIDSSNLDTDRAYIFCTVKLKDLKTKNTLAYTLVSEQEANLKEKKISIKSPVGKALMGKTVGELVEIKVPAGILQFEVLDITRE